MDKPTIPKGTRDFGPEKMVRRNFILGTIRDVFELYGFQPLETPALEQLSVLTGKYGDEGDQLIFKVLNSGDFLSEPRTKQVPLETTDAKKLTPFISEKALRYDLTVPFARYVAMNQGALTFPFRRYQMQPVWRADRPQKGRYREFIQCDADTVGTDSLLCEAEYMLMMQEVMLRLGIVDYTILLNHRTILSGLAESVGLQGQESAFCTALDKLDKIGVEGVCAELTRLGLEESKSLALLHYLNAYRSLDDFVKQYQNQKAIVQGASDLKEIIQWTEKGGGDVSKISFDATLARGLGYYTGPIFEIRLGGVTIGSVSGGGRYNNLTGLFGVHGIPGVGFSFGVDRLYDAMDALGLFDQLTLQVAKVLVCSLSVASRAYALKVSSAFRKEDIATELYPDDVRLKKQLQYAEKRSIPFVALIGETEENTSTVTMKHLVTGTQETVTIQQAIQQLQSTIL